MLAAEHRLTSGEGFRRAVKQGRRSGSRLLVLHLLDVDDRAPAGAPPRVGLVVSRAVGPAVVRNRVKRRLRHLARERVSSLPGRCVLVVRAQPAAAGADHAELGSALDRCLQRLSRDDREPEERA